MHTHVHVIRARTHTCAWDAHACGAHVNTHLHSSRQQAGTSTLALALALALTLPLQAGTSTHPSTPTLTAGRYVHSCLGCRLTSSSDGEHILECSHCSTADGHRRPTHTSIGHCPSGSFDNQDGALSCAPLPNSREVPAGPYLSSCLGCTLHRQGTSVAQATAPREALRWHTVLRCTHCRRADGVQVETSFTDPAQCLRSPGALLDNQNGELVCKLS